MKEKYFVIPCLQNQFYEIFQTPELGRGFHKVLLVKHYLITIVVITITITITIVVVVAAGIIGSLLADSERDPTSCNQCSIQPSLSDLHEGRLQKPKSLSR